MARFRTTLAACGVALLVLAGCSGGGDDEATTTSAPETTAAGPATTGPVDTTFTGQGSEEFCALARTYSERYSGVSANPTPAELRTLAREAQTAITQAESAAPSEIKGDVEVLARTFTALLAELEKVNFDIARLPPESLQGLSDPQFQAATTRFQAYTTNVCKLGG